jgi:hypothetical protein
VVTFQGESKRLANDLIETTKEVSSPGLIKIDQENNRRSGDGEKGMFNIVLHAMTHASVVNTVTLSKPLPFSEGLIIGYQGAAIKVLLKDGNSTFWRLLEEGICERNAALLGDYTVDSIKYFRLGNLALRHFPEEIDTIHYTKDSDVPGLIGIVLKKDPQFVTVQDIEKVMGIYQNELKK